MTTSALVLVAVVLGSAIIVLLLVRWLRLRSRGTGPAIETAHMVTCQTSDRTINTGCAESWFSHWWDGIPYCDDVEAECKLYGGKVISRT
jgi:hypothetical protein